MMSVGVVITVYLVQSQHVRTMIVVHIVYIQLDDVGMAQQLQILYLPFHSSCHIS